MKFKVARSEFAGVLLGITALLLHWFCPSAWIEEWHGGVVFPAISWILDHTIGLLPFAAFYLLLAGLLYMLFRLWRLTRPEGFLRLKTWALVVRYLFVTAGYVIFVFYFFWGFNYDRVQLLSRLSWDPAPISKEDFLEEGENQIIRLQKSALQDRYDLKESLAFKHYGILEQTIRNDAVSIARDLGYNVRTNVRCRQIAPAGILLRISTAGFYNPFSGECNIDPGLHPLQKPFVMAHEFFHGLGVTGEGDCNFLAYVLCTRSSHEFVRYSGELGYWRYLRGALRRTDAEAYNKMVEDLPLEVINDLRAIDEQILKYPDIAPRMRDALYSAYLRSNKIGDGLANYSRIINLVMNWRINHLKLR